MAFAAAGKIQGQEHGRKLGQAQQRVVGQDFQVGPDAAAAGGHDQAFQRARRMVGIEQQRSVRRDARHFFRRAVHVYFQSRQAGFGVGGGRRAA